MKILTVNFVTCAIKSCKSSPSSFPLHFRDAELELQELDFQPDFIRNILPRIDWEGLRTTINEVLSIRLFAPVLLIAPLSPLMQPSLEHSPCCIKFMSWTNHHLLRTPKARSRVDNGNK